MPVIYVLLLSTAVALVAFVLYYRWRESHPRKLSGQDRGPTTLTRQTVSPQIGEAKPKVAASPPVDFDEPGAKDATRRK